MARRQSFYGLLLVASLSAMAGAQSAEGVNRDLEAPWQATVDVSPFAKVNTASGTLHHEIPVFDVKGGQGMDLSLVLQHSSFAAGSGTAGGGMWQLQNGDVAQGWVHNWEAGIEEFSGNGVSGLGMFVGRNALFHWQNNVTSGTNWNFTRLPGCRGELRRLNATGLVTGYVVREIESRREYWFERSRPTPFGTKRWQLTKIVTPRTPALTTTVAYDPITNNVTTVTDPYGRTLTFQYFTVSSALQIVSGATFNAGGQTKNFVFNSDLVNSTYRLKTIVWPGTNGPPSSGTYFRPAMQFAYGPLNGNIQTLWDKLGRRWQYDYYSHGDGFLSQYRSTIKTVSPPTIGATTGQWILGGNAPYISTTAQGWYDPDRSIRFRWYRDQNQLNVDYKAWVDEPSLVAGVYGATTEHTYAGDPPVFKFLGNALKSTKDALNFTESFVWNLTDGTLTSRTDKDGGVTSATYDTGNRGQVQTLTDPLNKVWTTNWSDDLVIRTIGPAPLNTKTTYEYDGRLPKRTIIDPSADPHNGTTQSGAANVVTNREYYANGDLWKEWAGTDAPTLYSNYDKGIAETVTAPSGAVVTTDIDPWGLALSVTKPASADAGTVTTSTTYDHWARPLVTTHPDGKTTSVTYDWENNAVSATDERGVTVTTDYDVQNRAVKVTVPNSPTTLVTETIYDRRGDKWKTINPRGKVTEHTYDVLHQLVGIKYPDNTTRGFSYDGTGELKQRTNGRGQVTNITLDLNGRVTLINYQSTNTTDVSFTYNDDGTRATMTDGTGTRTYGYDRARRPISESQPLIGLTVSSTYDAGGRRKTLVAGSQTWTYNYDTTSLRLSNIAQTLGAATPASFAYFPDGAVKYRDANNSTRVWYAYDSRGRVTSVSHRSGSIGSETATGQFGYGYDDAGRITSMTDARQGQSTWTTAYTHDNVGRLLSENRTGGASGNFGASYAYDAQGNRTQVVRNGTTFAYGAASDNDRFTTGEGYSFGSYDNDGNPLSVAVPGGGTWTFVYDEESRPLSVTRGSSGTTTYRYDGEGRRVERAYSGSTTRYGWDGETEILETNGSNVVTLHRLPGVGVVKSGTQFFSQEDALGSSTIERSASGSLLATVRQDGYGQEVFRSGASASDYVWGGRHGYVTDPDSGMVLMNARFYLPAIGRFLTQDPIGHEGGLNLYAYCDNGPLTRVDPNGKDWDDAANFFGGWGHSLTFGLTGRISQSINRSLGYGEFQYGGAWFDGGRALGAVHGAALSGAGGWAAGSRMLTARAARAVLPNWQASEAALLAAQGGVAQYRMMTSMGPRIIDVFSKGVAHEAKYGYKTLSAELRGQIAKDAWLMSKGRLDGAVWHFYRSAATGRAGGSPQLMDALKNAGIGVKIHR